MLKILKLRNDMKVETLYLSHGVVTIQFHYYPHKLVQGRKVTGKDGSYVDIQSISLCDLSIQLVLVGWDG